MSQLPILSGRAIVKALAKVGYSKVRQRVRDFVGNDFRQVDGRCFSHLTAHDIRQFAGLPESQGFPRG